MEATEGSLIDTIGKIPLPDRLLPVCASFANKNTSPFGNVNYVFLESVGTAALPGRPLI